MTIATGLLIFWTSGLELSFFLKYFVFPHTLYPMKKSIFLLCLLVGLLFSALARGQELKWSKDGTSYYGLVKNEIFQYRLPDTNGELLVSTAQLSPAGEAPLKLTDFTFSEDGKKLLLFTNTKAVWRLQTQGDYFVYDLESKRLTQVGKGLAKSSLRFAKFSPDATQVAYVSEFNLYSEDLNTGQISALTRDGNRKLINGTFDWAYEEEFACRDGFQWSPDSKRIAFWQIDANQIRDYYMSAFIINELHYGYNVKIGYHKPSGTIKKYFFITVIRYNR
jgi:dipeptidyl-peptidase-4